MAKKSKVEQVKKALRAKSPRLNKVIPPKDLLSSGCTVLNLACSDRIEGAFAKGRYYFIVGDSQAGKTWITHATLAEAANNPEFNDYELIFDDAEGGTLMDVGFYFGMKTAERVKAPRYHEGEPVYSQRIEDLYDNIANLSKAGKKFIYVIDSMDALTSKASDKKYEEQKTAREKGKEEKGDFGDGKAKINAQNVRRTLSHLRETGSILIIINQTRDNPDAGRFEAKKTRSGGHALSFYASLEIWLSVGTKVKRTVRGKERKIGAISKARVKKNRVTGKDRDCLFSFYNEVGLDDVGTCVNYLCSEGTWKRAKDGTITASFEDHEHKAKFEAVIAFIEENDLENELQDICQETWSDIEERCRVTRKRRYE